MPDNTSSQLQEILKRFNEEYIEFDPNFTINQTEQSILALFMKCLPEKSDVSNQFKVLSINRIAYDAAFNKCIDITAQNIREIGRG